MPETRHPFSDERVATVADETRVPADDLDDALARVQDAIARDERDDEYEYSSEHNFGWHDDEAYYLYGDGIWETLRGELSLSADLADAAREVHRRSMMESAEERGDRESFEEMLADGTEPLVVIDTASDPPLFGQDV